MSNRGTGGISRTDQTLPGNVPPFVLTAANNGLSVDPITGRIVLGQSVGAIGDPARLLNNREIPLKGFTLTNLGNSIIEQIDDTLQLYQVTDPFFNPAIFLDFFNQDYALGDFFGGGNSTYVEADDANQRVDISATNRFRTLSGPAGVHKFIVNNGGAGDFIFQGTGNKKYLFTDPANNLYQYGDINAKNNSTFLEMRDSLKRINFFIGAGKSVFNFDQINGSYSMGDLGAVGNSMRLQIDDVNGIIDVLNAANTAKFVINGVNGFTGIVTPVTSITVNGGIVTNVT